MKLTELHIEGYRSLVNVTLPMRDLAVVIGPNGSGKTALLEVFLLLKAIAEGKLSERLDFLGGVPSILSRLIDPTQRLSIWTAVSIDKTDTIFEDTDDLMLEYSFALRSAGQEYYIALENLSVRPQQNRSNHRYGFERKHSKLTFFGSETESLQKLQIKNEYEGFLSIYGPGIPNELPDTYIALLKGIHAYRLHDVGHNALIRSPQTLTPAPSLGPSGEGLFSTLYNLQATQPDSFQRIIEVLQVGFPGFERLTFPAVGAGQVTLGWFQQGIKGPLYPNQLSEGMLRFLWLTTILLQPRPPAIMLLDEPEISLHPQLLMLLADLLQDAALRSQVVVATHSPELIRWLQPEHIVIADKEEDGSTKLTWADQLGLDFNDWLHKFTLGDMWLMGAIGGRS